MVEGLGFESLWRSDHLFSLYDVPTRPGLDAWASLAVLALTTRRIRFGPLVSPITFRHPSILAREAAAVDVLSGGRLELGLGAGWHAREHQAFGIPYPPVAERVRRLGEGVQVIRALWADGLAEAGPAAGDPHHHRRARTADAPGRRPPRGRVEPRQQPPGGRRAGPDPGAPGSLPQGGQGSPVPAPVVDGRIPRRRDGGGAGAAGPQDPGVRAAPGGDPREPAAGRPPAGGVARGDPPGDRGADPRAGRGGDRARHAPVLRSGGPGRAPRPRRGHAPAPRVTPAACR